MGNWFTNSQYPLLYKVSFSGNKPSTSSLATDPSSGTVWTGGWNGSDWLVTGYGWGNSEGLNPYYDVYDSQASQALSFANYTEAASAEQEWAGGDVFSSTWNGTMWLLTGMGSGVLQPNESATNHYSMAFLTSNGTFIDLSQSIPNNMDGILYASSWDGNDWLVGGGYYQWDTGVLYLVTPAGNILDITDQISSSIPNFEAVQSIGWNGTVWMIGGEGFLAAYNPNTGAFYDLTGAVDSELSASDSLDNSEVNSVNSIVWTDGVWMIAGGATVAFVGNESQSAWVASINPQDGTVADLTSRIIPSTILTNSSMSSVLSMACSSSGCVLGGFADSSPMLIWYDGSSEIDLSNNLQGMHYVQWVGLSGSLSRLNGSPSTTIHTFPWPKGWRLALPNLRLSVSEAFGTFCTLNPW